MHTPRLFGLLFALARGFPLLGHADTGVPSSIRYDRAAAPNPIVISWPASPGDAYLLKAAPVLGSPWQALTPSPLLAITNGLLWRDTADQRARFYQVFRLEGDLTLQGQVTDALNGSPLAGVTVTAGGRTAVTDSQGAYTLANLSAGSLAVDFTAAPLSGQAPLTVRFQNLSSATPAIVTVTGAKPGYFTYTNAQVTLLGGGPSRLDFSLSPIAVGKLRFVLNWGARPKDLDAHLVTPSIGGKSYEIYYAPNHHGDTNGPPYAQLDVDRTAGFGPETITINRFEPGTYRYYVHNYQEDQGNTGELRDSGAVVQVYSDLGLLRTINLPAGEEGAYWEVCAIDGATGKLTVVNALRALKPASVGGFPDGEPGVKAMSDGENRAARFLWDFGDQTSSEEENPVKVYAAAGVYDVSLRVWFADQRTASQLKPRFITVTAPPAGVSVSVTDASSLEGNGRGSALRFSVRLSQPSAAVARVDYATADDTAVAGVDYEATRGTLVFNPGQTNQEVMVPILGDRISEADETLFLNLSNSVNAELGDAQGVGYIVDDEEPPLLTINDAAMTAGPAGEGRVVFTVRLSDPSGQEVTVNWRTVDGTALAGRDFLGTNGLLRWAPGQTNQTFAVPVPRGAAGSNLFFYAQLTNAVGALLADDQGIGTITDWLPQLRIGDARVVEGNRGQVEAVFAVSLSSPITRTARVSYATADGTAAAGSDYAAASGELVFAPGQTNQTVAVQVNGDLLNEADAVFYLRLSQPVEATIAVSQGVGTIVNDDPEPTLLVTPGTVTEGNTGLTNMAFRVRLSTPSGREVTVAYQTVNGTALAGLDYVATNGLVTLAPGTSGQTIWVGELGDTLAEGDEVFYVDLSQPAGAAIPEGAGRAEGLISDDDLVPLITITDATAVEGEAAVFTVRLSVAGSQPVTVRYATTNGTALAGQDYVAGSGTLTFTPGMMETNVTVATWRDGIPENDESFSVRLSEPQGAAVEDGEGRGSIQDHPEELILITRQPEDQTVAAGTNVTLQVAATGPTPLGYQWRKADLELSGATNATLVMNRVQTNDAGNYTVVVSGPFGGAVTSRVAVVTVRTLPSERAWTRIWGTPGNDYVGGMVADQAGSVYVVGATTGALDGQTNLGGADAFLTKYTTNGVKVWTRQWGGGSEDSASVVAVDGAGDIYVAGSTLVSGDPAFGDWDAVLTKFAPDGRLLWSEQWGSNQHDFGYGLTVDASNQVYVAGYTWSTFDGEPGGSGTDAAFVSKFAPDGKRLWSRIWRPGPENVASPMVADRAGNLYVAGFTKGPVPGQPFAGDFDYYLNKYSADGVLQWTRTGGSSARDGAGGLGVDSLGRIYVCGWTYGALAGQTNAGDGDVFLAQYLPDGSPGWTRQFGSSGFEYINAIKVDAADHLWVSGYSDGAFDGQTNAGGNDAFLTVFASDGTQLWTRFLGSAAADIGVAVDIGLDGAIYQAGYTAGAFDGETTAGGYDACLTRWLPPALPATPAPTGN